MYLKYYFWGDDNEFVSPPEAAASLRLLLDLKRSLFVFKLPSFIHYFLIILTWSNILINPFHLNRGFLLHPGNLTSTNVLEDRQDKHSVYGFYIYRPWYSYLDVEKRWALPWEVIWNIRLWLWELDLAGLGVPGTWCEGLRSSHMRSIGIKCFWWEGGCGRGNRLHNCNHSQTIIFTHTVPHSGTHSYTLTDTHTTQSHTYR